MPALFADVDLPIVSGGFDAYGYRGVLVLSNDAPRTFKGPGEGRIVGEELVNIIQYVTLDAPGTLRLTPMVPLEDRSYSPCFAFNVWDPNGQTKSTSVCLPAQDIDRFAPELVVSTPTQGSDAGAAGKHDEPRSIMDEDAAMAAAPDAGTNSPAMPNPSGRDGGTKPAASDERAAGCAVSAGGMQPAGLASMLSVLGALLALVLRRRQLC